MDMKRMMLMAFSVVVLMMSWEGQLTSANVMDNGPIPQESIRLRIIANSDSFQDQWLKREVRDALIVQMNTWAEQIGSYAEAREVVAANLPKLQQVVDKTVRDRGFSYKSAVDFGQVPFPTKLYGSYVYPAGEYEALRVQIGEAKGQNWWCVLFPPLCFIDMSNGDAVEAAARPEEAVAPTAASTADVQGIQSIEKAEVHAGTKEEPEARIGRTRGDWQEWRQVRLEEREVHFGQEPVASVDETVVATDGDQPEAAIETAPTTTEEAPPAPQVQVRFYIWEKLEKLFS